MALLRFTRTTAFHEAQDSRWPFPFTFDAKMPDQFCGAVCAAPFVVFQRRIEMAGVEGIGEISEKNVRPSLFGCPVPPAKFRSEEHTSELQSLMRISYAVFCLKKKKQKKTTQL